MEGFGGGVGGGVGSEECERRKANSLHKEPIRCITEMIVEYTNTLFGFRVSRK